MLETVGGLIPAGVLAATFAIAAARSAYVLNPGQSAVRMFLGTVRGFSNTPGLHLKAPWERLSKLDTMQQSKDLELENVLTEDNYYVTLPVELRYRIVNPEKFLFHAVDPEHQMFKQVENIIRSQAANMKFKNLYSSKDDFEKAVWEHEHTRILDTFGIELERIIPGDPKPTEEVLHALNERIRKIADAEGNKEAQRLEGEGAALKQNAITEGFVRRLEEFKGKMPPEIADAIFVLSMAYHAQEAAGEKGNLILATSDPQALLAQQAAVVAALAKHSPALPTPAA